jgi:cell wall integrity and stress response component
VYLTGVEEGTPNEDPAPTSSSSSSSSSSTTEIHTSSSAPQPTAPAVTITPSATATSTPEKPVNKAGIAAGVVVGVLAIAGIGIGVFLLMKKRRREKVEEEYRKSAAAREFARKPEQDHRLDPVMIQRRDSVGSIADNQDYSRRILKVTNPDGN